MKIDKKKICLYLLFIVSIIVVVFVTNKDFLIEKNEKIDCVLKFRSILISLKDLSSDKEKNNEIVNEELKKLIFFNKKNIENQSIFFSDKSIFSFGNIVNDEGFIFYDLEFKNNNFTDCLYILNNKIILENSLVVKIKNKKTSNYIFLKNDFINDLEDKKSINNFCNNEDVEFVISKKELLIN